MNRWIKIDHPYDIITLEFVPSILRKDAAPLRTDEWKALESAERRIHHTNPGCNGWTDVMCNDGDENLNWLWSHSKMYTEEDYRVYEMKERGAKQESVESWILHETARRVAQSLTIIAFGAEILIAG